MFDSFFRAWFYVGVTKKSAEPKSLWQERHDALDSEMIYTALALHKTLEGAIRYLGISRPTMKERMARFGLAKRKAKA